MGIPVTDEDSQRLGHSVAAAKQGIFQVVISRICMAIPAMGEAEVPGWGTGGSQRMGGPFSRGFEHSGGCHSGGSGRSCEGGSTLLRIPTFTSLTPSFSALLSLQPFPP